MSIAINKDKCISCHQCVEVCPGNLIKLDDNKKAHIDEIKNCWGCASCIKECKIGAIKFFLGADIGGLGSNLDVKEEENFIHWIIEDKEIIVDKRNSNAY